jgi:hypothetical protein
MPANRSLDDPVLFTPLRFLSGLSGLRFPPGSPLSIASHQIFFINALTNIFHLDAQVGRSEFFTICCLSMILIRTQVHPL